MHGFWVCVFCCFWWDGVRGRGRNDLLRSVLRLFVVSSASYWAVRQCKRTFLVVCLPLVVCTELCVCVLYCFKVLSSYTNPLTGIVLFSCQLVCDQEAKRVDLKLLIVFLIAKITQIFKSTMRIASSTFFKPRSHLEPPWLIPFDTQQPRPEVPTFNLASCLADTI